MRARSVARIYFRNDGDGTVHIFWAGKTLSHNVIQRRGNALYAHLHVEESGWQLTKNQRVKTVIWKSTGSWKSGCVLRRVPQRQNSFTLFWREDCLSKECIPALLCCIQEAKPDHWVLQTRTQLAFSDRSLDSSINACKKRCTHLFSEWRRWDSTYTLSRQNAFI